jgi:hypothetical protein
MRVSYASDARRWSVVSRRSLVAELSRLVFVVLAGLQFGLCRPDDAGVVRESLYEYASEGPPRPGLSGINGDGRPAGVRSGYLWSRESVGVDMGVSVDGAMVVVTTLGTRGRGVPEAEAVGVPESVGVSRCVSEALLEHEQRMLACGYGMRRPVLVLAGRGGK